MYTYICCRCTNCVAQIALEEQSGSNTNLFRDLLGHVRGEKLVPTIGRCSRPKHITSHKVRRLFCSELKQKPFVK